MPPVIALILLASFIAALALPCSGEDAGERLPVQPNVVFVITDDQGYGDLSCHGNPVLDTPELDRLHRESVRLTDYHVSPTCAPTRAALMSGHYANRAGVWHTVGGRSLLFKGETTLGEVFENSGYRTGLFGKWHLGDNYPFRPEDRGFQEVVRHGGGGVGQTPDYWDNAYFDDTYFHNGKPRRYEGYCTDVFFEEATDFIEKSFDSGKPFFAYISTNAPHSPFHCPEEYWKPYQEQGLSQKEAIFFGMIANIDENVGKLRRWLDRKGAADNTILIFTTDNGTAAGEDVFNANLRGKKGSVYDGGHRVPFFVHWPVGGLDEGRDIAQLAAHIDVLPTLIELCGLNPPPDYLFDGRSLAPLLFETPVPWPQRTIITDSQRIQNPVKWRKSSVMTEQWRLIDGQELYRIDSDPAQERDLSDRDPAVVDRLRAEYERWWASLKPVFSTYGRIALGHPSQNPTLLTGHDWLTNDGPAPWNQAHIRNGVVGEGMTGRWAVEVTQPGRYRIALRRWPPEVDILMTDGLAPGKPVPGLEAFRETPGREVPIRKAVLRIGDLTTEAAVPPAAAESSFTMDLPAGPAFLDARFEREDGAKLGAYYVTVDRID